MFRALNIISASASVFMGSELDLNMGEFSRWDGKYHTAATVKLIRHGMLVRRISFSIASLIRQQQPAA